MTFLTRAEAAQLLRCSVRKIDRMSAAGKLPARRVGRSILFERAAVEAAAVPMAAPPKPVAPEPRRPSLLDDRLWRERTRRMLRGDNRRPPPKEGGS